jgi:large subunit ribosomal protein L21
MWTLLARLAGVGTDPCPNRPYFPPFRILRSPTDHLMAYAIFKTGGKQYKVKQGDTLDVELLPLEVGSETSFSDVLYVNDGETALIGNPLVEGAVVRAKVVDQHRADKVTAFKYRRRKGYHKTKGHRRSLTRLQITGIA